MSPREPGINPGACRRCGARVLTYAEGYRGEFLAVDPERVSAADAARAVLTGRGACCEYPETGSGPGQLTRLTPLTVRDRLVGLAPAGVLHLDHLCPDPKES